jgi:energy-coupling factor transport system permease protein
MSFLVPSYRPTGSALHAARPAAAIAYVAAPCAVVVVFDHPLVLAAALAAIVASALVAGLGREIARAARLALPLALLVALVNPLVSREGLTVIAAGPVLPVIGPLDVTLEALVYGGVAALRVVVVILAFALYSAAVDPDDVLRAFRRLSFRSALTASLATRLVPMLGRDAARLSEAYGLRAAAPAAARGRLAGVRRGALLTRALAAGALERAVDMAAALEVRGYALAPRFGAAPLRRPWARQDVAFVSAAAAVAIGALGARLAGVAHFRAYPSLELTLGAPELVLAAVLVAAMLSPYWVARRGLRSRRGAPG